jgi:hypothetical protein
MLQCSEIVNGKTGKYEVPQYFVLQDGSLRWDNKKADLSLVTNTPATIEATGKVTEHMPLPAQIDQCVKAAVANNPTLLERNGEIKFCIA